MELHPFLIFNLCVRAPVCVCVCVRVPVNQRQYVHNMVVGVNSGKTFIRLAVLFFLDSLA